MKEFNKSSIFTGVVLLALAALFSISLILLPLDFGIAGPGHDNFFFKVGSILFSVYGYSSIFIPVFLFLAGISCFATKWTARKTMRFITALVPFFTCVITEKICRSVIAMGHSEFLGVKIAVIIITGLMLVVIEYFGAGILADKINKKTGHKSEPSASVGFTKLKTFKLPSDFDSEAKSDDANTEEVENNSENETEAELEPVDDENNDHTTEYMEKGAIFDDVLSDLEPIELEEIEEAPEVESENIENETDAKETENNDDEYEGQNSTSVITQEEFAALTDPSPLDDDVPEELEWANLPPASATLPPEYDADFDENDPALEFPPKETKSEENEEEDFGFEELTSDFDEIEKASLNDLDSDYETFKELDDKDDNSDDGETTLDDFKVDLDFDELDLEDVSGFDENPVEENHVEESGLEEIIEDSEEVSEEAPKNTVRYKDNVIKNPKFPYGITIRDEEEDEDGEEGEKVFVTSDKDDDNDDYEEDVTLPFPDIDDMDEMEEVGSINFDENDEIEIEKVPETEEEPDIFNQIASQEEQASSVYTGMTSADVFADMESDIRKEQENELSQKVRQPSAEEFDSSLGPHQISANNLTADELSDFFNAQQKENTPKTTAIAANPPKVGNRATKKGPYVIPSDLLTAYEDDQYWIIDDATKQSALNLKQTLAEFNIEADITGIKKGPVVTMFEILPAPGVRLSKIVQLQDNIALSLAAQSVRIVAPIPGKQAVGIEVPNKHRSVVGFREIIEMNLPEWKKMAVPVILGKDILGKAQLIDLVKTPHMLIAGATGSGKSVCVNSLILSILYKRSFKDVKLILVDPKVVELKLYNNIPHLLTPVITEPKKALKALQYCLCEMERRYALLDSMGVRDISNYNQKIKEQKICTEKLPYIVVIIDEFADLMATSGKELESIVARLTAMSRAVGIHLVLATQRPSVNVITGLIKANIPTRIAFMVASRTDSNIIIDSNGAEKLLGRGDMLYASAVDPAPIRIQGTFVSDQEVEDVVNAVKEYGEPDYLDDSIFEDDEDERATDLFGEPMDDDDPLYDQALEIVVQAGKASASYIQRRLKIGYNRAARLVEEMEERGIVGPANGSKPREIIHIP